MPTFYSSTAVQTTLTGGISNSSLTAQVASTVGWPSSYPYVIAIDYGGAAEELCTVTNNSAGVLTITRAFDSTSAQSHSIGAVVRHVYCANDATAFRTHEAATAAVHGVAGTIVGTTDTQTLTNKTLTSPTINSPTVSGGTFSGTAAFAAATFSGTAALNGGGSWTGTLTGTGNEVINGSAIGTVVSVLNGITGQTADLQDWRVNGTTLASMDKSGIVHTAGAVMTGTMSGQPSATTGVVLSSNVGGTQAFDNFRLYGDGKMEWGSGTAARDVNLYRASSNLLKTDFNFTVAGTSFNAVQGTFTTTSPSGNINVSSDMALGATGTHFIAKTGGSEVFSVQQGGSVFALDMAVGEGEDATSGRTTTSLTFAAVGTLTATCTVPESGKMLVMMRVTARNSTSNNSISSFDAVGSVSGSLYSANDAAAVIVTGTNNLSLTLFKKISSGSIGEIVTITPKHRVNSASTMTIDYRDIVVMPLMS